MKKLSILFTILFISIFSYSQGFLIIKDGDNLYTSTGSLYLKNSHNNPVLFISFNKCYSLIKETIKYDIDLTFYKISKTKSNIGDSVLIKLVNNTIIGLENKSVDFGLYSKLFDKYSNVLHLELSEKDVENISNQGIKKVQISIGSSDFEIEIKDKEKFKKEVSSFLKLDLSNLDFNKYPCVDDY